MKGNVKKDSDKWRKIKDKVETVRERLKKEYERWRKTEKDRERHRKVCIYVEVIQYLHITY